MLRARAYAQVDKQSLRRHCDAITLEHVASFYKGMGAGPIKLVNKSNGQVKNDWFKAAKYSEMVAGSASFPGGITAWGPSLVLLVGDCKLGVRNAVRSGASAGPAALMFSAAGQLRRTEEFEAGMARLYGRSTAATLLQALRCQVPLASYSSLPYIHCYPHT